MTACEDKMNILISAAQLLYSDNFKSTRRIAKVMMVFAQLFSLVENSESKKEKNDRHRFLMGSLYALGGLLKVEAKSYLMTLNERYEKDPESNKERFVLVCPFSNPENELDEKEKGYIRSLNPTDEKFFKNDFY